MNKQLFWTGIFLQLIHLGGFMILGLLIVDWDLKILLGIVYVIFNVVSLAMIFAGAVMKERIK